MSMYLNFYGEQLQRYYACLPDLPKSDGLFVDNATELMQIENRAKGGSLEIESSSASCVVYIDLTDTTSTYLYFFLAAFTASCSASNELNVSAS